MDVDFTLPCQLWLKKVQHQKRRCKEKNRIPNKFRESLSGASIRTLGNFKLVGDTYYLKLVEGPPKFLMGTRISDSFQYREIVFAEKDRSRVDCAIAFAVLELLARL